MPQARILVGQLGAAHGVKGEVRLKSFTQDPAAIGRYTGLTDASGARSFVIEALRPLKDDLFVARLAGVTTRGEAEKLTNVTLYMARENLPAAEEDEFYYADLIGLRAETLSGVVLGNVVQVLNFGAGDILEVLPPEDGETLLVPFTKEAVPRIDVAGGHIVVAPPLEVTAEDVGNSALSPSESEVERHGDGHEVDPSGPFGLPLSFGKEKGKDTA